MDCVWLRYVQCVEPRNFPMESRYVSFFSKWTYIYKKKSKIKNLMP